MYLQKHSFIIHNSKNIFCTHNINTISNLIFATPNYKRVIRNEFYCIIFHIRHRPLLTSANITFRKKYNRFAPFSILLLTLYSRPAIPTRGSFHPNLNSCKFFSTSLEVKPTNICMHRLQQCSPNSIDWSCETGRCWFKANL